MNHILTVDLDSELELTIDELRIVERSGLVQIRGIYGVVTVWELTHAGRVLLSRALLDNTFWEKMDKP